MCNSFSSYNFMNQSYTEGKYGNLAPFENYLLP